jgi:hypothetical protein
MLTWHIPVSSWPCVSADHGVMVQNCFDGSANLAWTYLIQARLAMKGGQGQDCFNGSADLAWTCLFLTLCSGWVWCMTCFNGSADLAWTCLILARLAMKGGQVQEPKLMTSGSPALARLSSGTCNSPPDWLTFFGSFFWSNSNLLGAWRMPSSYWPVSFFSTWPFGQAQQGNL